MAEAAKPQGGEEDPSMEEILQSIRRIIAEDEPAANGKATNGVAETVVPGSEVLELTEMVKEDGTVVSLKDQPQAAAAPVDVLNKIDQALTPEKPAEAPKPAAPAAAAPKPAKPAAPPADSMLSAQVASTTAAAFEKLKTIEEPETPLATTPSPAFRSGTTIEDMVAQMLKPMIKEWLDANLPAIVERIVEREVKRLTK